MPLGSVNDCGGVNPAGRGISIGVAIPAGMRTGLPTEPPLPQHVEVMSRKKLHCSQLGGPCGVF
jgi:hypothetical protein